MTDLKIKNVFALSGKAIYKMTNLRVPGELEANFLIHFNLNLTLHSSVWNEENVPED